MTTLGRILVIVNLVLSMLAAFFMVAIHAQSTNWHNNFVQAQKQLTVAVANADTYKAEIDRVRNEESTKVVNADKKLKETEKERDTLRAEADSYKQRYDKAVSQSKDIDGSREGVSAELARRKAENDLLIAQKAATDRKLLELEKDKRELRDRAVASGNEAKAQQDRNEQLLAQLEQMSRDLQRAQTVSRGGKPSPSDNPPPEDVEGVVTQVDAQTGYITISIGSDAGLSRGNTLEVYRLKEGRYLGTIRILEVRSSEAVAKPVVFTPGRTAIRVGDHVSSKITVRR